MSNLENAKIKCKQTKKGCVFKSTKSTMNSGNS